jgi:hypothetical protein
MWVIREVIEGRSGMDYRDFVRKHICEPGDSMHRPASRRRG